MYEQTFNFSQRPFSVCPQSEEYFPGESHQQAIAASGSCVERRNGPATIIGGVGTGKSLTLQVIGELFSEQFDVVSIECSRLEQRSELLQSILFGMDLPYREMGEGELRLSLIDHLKNGNGSSNGILLLVDEAGRLSIELLDELRLITNIMRDGLSQAQLVLAGTQRLEEALNDPRLASFSQRVASRSYLQNLSRNEVDAYIDVHIQRAGRQAVDVFDEAAIDEVARSSDGCPRLINQLCERSLAVAAAQEQTKVTQDIVQHAWAELQNLPIPSRSACSADTNADSTCGDSSESVVEFGSLDDDQNSESFSSNYSGQADEDSSQQDTLEPEFTGSQPDNDDGSDEPDLDSQATEYSEDQEHVASEDEDDASAAWDGQFPTNLGVTDYRSFGAGAAGFAAATYGSGGGDPFAPEDELPTMQQFQYGSELENESQPVPESLPRRFDSQGGYDFDSEPVGDGSVGNDDDGSVQSLEQEQEDLLEEVDAATTAVDDLSLLSAQVDDGSADVSEENDVQAAFDGLEQIDQARSSETVQISEQQAVEPAVDPFNEDFEEEVLLQDAYSPFVAQQNKSSLTVTSEHLSHLQPNDDVDVTEDTNDFESVENEAPEADQPSGFVMPTAETDASYIPVQSVATELSFPELSESTEPQESVEEEIDHDLAALTNDFSFDDDPQSHVSADEVNAEATPMYGAEIEDGIHDQTADLSRDIRSVIDSDVSPETEDSLSHQPTSVSSESLGFGSGDDPQGVSDEVPEAIQYSQQPPLDEPQRVLREILAQQQIVKDAQSNPAQQDENDVDSVSVEYPITDHDNYQTPSDSNNDDRDILRVNESHYSQTPQKEPEQPTPYADAKPSTGEAQRMDYGQLFDQLRNMPKE